MKNLTRIFALLLLGAFSISFFNVPFSEIIRTSIFSSGIIYFSIIKPTLEHKEKGTSILTGISISIFLIGILFAIMYWPSSRLILDISMLALGSVTLFLVFRQLRGDKPNKEIFIVTVSCFCLSLLCSTTFFWDRFNYIKYRDYQYFTEAAKQYFDNPTDENWKNMTANKGKIVPNLDCYEKMHELDVLAHSYPHEDSCALYVFEARDVLVNDSWADNTFPYDIKKFIRECPQKEHLKIYLISEHTELMRTFIEDILYQERSVLGIDEQESSVFLPDSCLVVMEYDSNN